MSAVTRTVSIIALSTMVAAPCMAQSIGGFTPTGDMTAPRGFLHTATRLHDGKVLMAGCTRTTSAELYDPASHTFTPTGSMTAVRCGHSATLLADGRVLIAGGYRQAGENLNSAEVYDPSTGTFTPTGDMIGLQIGHTATLLPNGSVLIAGGLASGCFGCPAQVNNPELYDPSTGTFSLTGAFAGKGNVYVTGGPAVTAAVALPDGRVLIAGEPTSELYDPFTGTFQLTGAMTNPCRFFQVGYIAGRTATMLTNGLVLLTGGEHEDCGRFANAELYDVVTGRFTATGSMTRPRTNHSATLLPDGTVLIAGGESEDCNEQRCSLVGTVASAEVFDPSAGTFTLTADMSARRAGHSATALDDGTVLVAGGYAFVWDQVPCCVETASAELWTPAAGSTPVVTADSVTPNSGSGMTQTFGLQYSDTAGASDLTQAWVWFNATFASSAANSCLLYYVRATNTLNLIDDGGTGWLAATLGSGTLQNSSCAVALGSSTAPTSGNTLTLNLAITFKAAFVGAKNIYMYVTNGTQNSGWQTRGTWTVPAGSTPVVTADLVTPNSGSGTTQTLALAYSDAAGASDLTQVWAWINATFSSTAANSCMVHYVRATNTLNLINDAGTAWLSLPLGGGGTLENSSCAIALGSTSTALAGNTLTLNLALTFKPAFAGKKYVFMYATNGSQNSGWQTRGTWTVPAGGAVTANSVTPNAGSGATQTFALQYGDTGGGANLTQTWVWFNATFASTAANSCLVYYDATTGQLNLINDAGTAWLSAALGGGALRNASCTIALGSSSRVISGNTLTLTLALTFTPAFSGGKNVYLYATDGTVNSGWQTRGTWTVPSPSTP
jgi:hypothetical protein